MVIVKRPGNCRGAGHWFDENSSCAHAGRMFGTGRQGAQNLVGSGLLSRGIGTVTLVTAGFTRCSPGTSQSARAGRRHQKCGWRAAWTARPVRCASRTPNQHSSKRIVSQATGGPPLRLGGSATRFTRRWFNLRCLWRDRAGLCRSVYRSGKHIHVAAVARARAAAGFVDT